MLTRIRQIEIEIAVVEMLEDYDLKPYPMSMGRVAEALGIEVVQYSKLSNEVRESAFKISDDAFAVSSADYTITRMAVNNMRGFNSYRARFSGGHEIGHIYLGHGEDTPQREEEADYFSGYLLAPHPLITVRRRNRSVSEVFGISERCARQAMRQTVARNKEGGTWRPHEQWLLKNVTWGGGGLVGNV